MERDVRVAIQEYAENVVRVFSRENPVGHNINDFVNALGGTIQEKNLKIWADGKLEMAPVGSGIRFIITLSPMQSQERKNFTIAHEIGHLFLHTNYVDSLINSNVSLVFPDFYREGDSEKEYQANEFAANILMPKDIYIQKVRENITDNGNINIKNVSEYFGVSVDAAINRGKWLGVLSW